MKFSIKKVALLVFALAMCSVLSFAVCAENMTISADTVTVEEGSTETISVPVSLGNNPGLATLKLEVVAPEGFTLTGVVNSGKVFGDGDVIINLGASPYPIVSYVGINPATASDVLLTLQFKLNGATKSDYDVKIRVPQAKAGDGSNATAYTLDGTVIGATEAVSIGTISVIPKKMTISADTVTVEEGSTETISVPVSLGNNPGLATLKLEVVAPEGFTLTGVVNSGKVFGDGDVIINLGASPYPIVSYVGINPATANDVLLTLQFALDGATPADYDVKIRVPQAKAGDGSNATAYTLDGTVIGATEAVSIGIITVTEPSYATIKVDPVTVVEGATSVEVPVKFLNNPGFSGEEGMGIYVSFVIPEGFIPTEIINGDVFAEFDDEFNMAIIDEGVCEALWYSGTEKGTGETLCTLVLEIDDTVTLGDYEVQAYLQDNGGAEICAPDKTFFDIETMEPLTIGAVSVVSADNVHDLIFLTGGFVFKSEVGMQFGVGVNDGFVYDVSKVKFVVNGDEFTAVDTTPVYSYPARTFLDQEWTVQFYYDEELISDGEYSYLNYVESPVVQSDAKLKKLCDAMVLYCKYAANYFGNGNYTGLSVSATPVNVDGHQASIVLGTSGIRYADYEGSSLLLKEMIYVRHYFQLTNLSKTPSMTDGVSNLVMLEDGAFYVEQPVNFSDLDKELTFKIKGLATAAAVAKTFTCNALDVIIASANSDQQMNGTNLSDVVKALYLFWEQIEANL